MQARARILSAPAVDGPALQIEIGDAQPCYFRRTKPMPVSEQDHRVVARAVARALLSGAEEQRDFVAGEIVAQGLFMGHRNTLPRTPSPSSPRSKPRVRTRRVKKAHRPRRARPFPADRFSRRNSQPNAQSVASLWNGDHAHEAARAAARRPASN